MILYCQNRNNIKLFFNKYGYPALYQKLNNGVICSWMITNPNGSIIKTKIFDALGRQTIDITLNNANTNPSSFNFASGKQYNVTNRQLAIFNKEFDNSTINEKHCIFLKEGKLFKGKFRAYYANVLFNNDVGRVENISANNFGLLKMAISSSMLDKDNLSNMIETLGSPHYVFFTNKYKILYYIGVHMCNNRLKTLQLQLIFNTFCELISRQMIANKCSCITSALPQVTTKNNTLTHDERTTFSFEI